MRLVLAYCTISVNGVVCAMPLAVVVTVTVYVPDGVPGTGAGGVGVGPALEPPPQPVRSVPAATGISTRQAVTAKRTARMRPAGLCIQVNIMAMHSSRLTTVMGKKRIAVGDSMLGSDSGSNMLAAVVETVMVIAAGPAGVTVTALVGAVQVALDGAPVHANVTLNVSVGAPPVAESCRA